MKVFLTGAFFSVFEEEMKRSDCYEKVLADFFKKKDIVTMSDISLYRKKIKSEHPTLTEIELDKASFDYEAEHLRQSDLVICDISKAVMSTGFILGMAHEMQKDVIFAYERKPRIGIQETGGFPNSTFIVYDTLDELDLKLRKVLTERGYGKPAK